ncbi:hypothetical protein HK098_000886 [Nowakowskiella sp. JEL0407]|nr:hypothetical protein HK098_000886 [Nowakowskiella sp. JEL0407]
MAENTYSWMIINSTIQPVLSEHGVVDRLRLNTNWQFEMDSPFPSRPVVCDHYSHYDVVVDIEPLRKFWFKDDGECPVPIISEQRKPINSLQNIIMLSYCWGKKDTKSNIYPDQERVKKLASDLKARGFEVWLDIHYMNGNMISTMKNVIENCAAMIACVTNDYHVENSNGYDEFVYACAKKRDKVIGVKLTADADMMGGAYGFKKGLKDLYYDLSSEDVKVVEEQMDKLEQYLRSLVRI